MERLARKANERTRSLGVAFSGCSLPGADAPLFSVPEGRMAIGMGLHGEPGLSEGPITDAPTMAAMLVEQLLAERPSVVPATAHRVVALLNGFGRFKYEEMFVLFGAVSRQLQESGVVLADCVCGELATSLDMAGVSLSLCWVDDELEALWNAPADSAAFRRGGFPDTSHPNPVAQEHAHRPEPDRAAASIAARPADPALLVRLGAVHTALRERAEELGALDAVAGDGDHGLGMLRGSQGALERAADAVARGCGTAQVLAEAGEAWSDLGGGTSGALWGAALVAAGDALPKAAGTAIDAAQLAAAVEAALQAVVALGKAAPGDKTMVDALQPFSERLRADVQAGLRLDQALQNAGAASLRAALATADLLPKRGRARPRFGRRSLGHPDPGALSLAYCVLAAIQPPHIPAAGLGRPG